MPGSEWGRLVAEPSPVEVEAALAEVRVRAVPIARRAQRNRSAAIGLAALVLVAGGAMMGAAYGLRMTGGAALASLPGPLEVVRVAAGPEDPALPGTGMLRYHITSWSELDGVRMGEAEAWVEGPAGLTFRVQKWFDATGFDGWFSSLTSDGSLTLRPRVQVQRLVSGAGEWSALSARAGSRSIDLGRHSAALIYPFGESTADEPVTLVRVDGPYAAPPSSPAQWQRPDPSRWISDGPANLAAARAAGVRVVVRNAGAMRVTAGLAWVVERVRFQLEGHPPSRVLVVSTAEPRGRRVAIPGAPDSTLAVFHSGREPSSAACFSIHRLGREIRPRHREWPVFAQGCLPYSGPVTVRTVTGGLLRAEFVR
jgi:hypothetical protein